MRVPKAVVEVFALCLWLLSSALACCRASVTQGICHIEHLSRCHSHAHFSGRALPHYSRLQTSRAKLLLCCRLPTCLPSRTRHTCGHRQLATPPVISRPVSIKGRACCSIVWDDKKTFQTYLQLGISVVIITWFCRNVICLRYNIGTKYSIKLL